MGLWLILTATALGLLIAGWVAGAGAETSLPHPELAPMRRGIDGGALGAPLWSGYATGLLVLAMFWIALLAGFRDRSWIRIVIGTWSIGYGVVFIALVRSFTRHGGGGDAIFAGFTEPAAWLVYGVGLFPSLLLLFVTLAFRQVCFGEEDQARFDALLEGARRELVLGAAADSDPKPARD